MTLRSPIKMLPPAVIPELLGALDSNDTDDNGAYQLLARMNPAVSPAPAEECVVHDFAVLLLRYSATREGAGI